MSKSSPIEILPGAHRKSDAATGASVAGLRTAASQVIAFYFRAPAKAFFRTRVDYLVLAKAVNPRIKAQESWSWRISVPGLLGHAVASNGWSFIPNQVLPPLLANIGIGAILYTSYLQILGQQYPPFSKPVKRVFPPPPARDTFIAGAAAGAIQSVVAAPIDVLQFRFKTDDILSGKYKNMWRYGFGKLREIGPRGAFAGWGLSLVKDTVGYGIFFATFEYVKAQSYYAFATRYYGNLQAWTLGGLPRQERVGASGIPTIKPHYAIEPAFLLFAGVSASVLQQLINHPLSAIQEVHHSGLDERPQAFSRSAYEKTLRECSSHVLGAGGWRQYFYRGFIWDTLRQIPSTSAGLVIFELVRRRYADESEAMRIQKDGYEIVLS